MSEHTPLTEAERIVREGRDAYLPSEGLDPAWIAGWHAATDHHAHALASQAKCPKCGHASHGEDDGCFEEVAFDRMCGCPDIALAARTSTATADTEGCWQPCDPDCEVGPVHCVADHLPSHKSKTVLHTAECVAATADTGLRERVEALANEWEREEAELVVWYGHEQCAVNSAAKKLRAILDATAAPTTDTGARDE